MAKNKVFLDSSVILAAVLSSSGGSFYILNNLRNDFEFYINEYVFEEVIAVLSKKFSEQNGLKNKLFLLLGIASIKVIANPTTASVKSTARYVNPKDAPILASAIKFTNYFLTFDEDFLTAKVLKFAKERALLIMKPRDFIAKLGRI